MGAHIKLYLLDYILITVTSYKFLLISQTCRGITENHCRGKEQENGIKILSFIFKECYITNSEITLSLIATENLWQQFAVLIFDESLLRLAAN